MRKNKFAFWPMENFFNEKQKFSFKKKKFHEN